MTDDMTPRLALPLLHAGQAQKEADHNEAILRLDLAVQATVREVGRDVPPATATGGECWIVGSAPIGAWEGHAGEMAGWSEGGWRFVVPRDGMAVWCIADRLVARYDDTGWTVGMVPARCVTVAGQQVLAARQAAISLPAGGAVIDIEARSAVSRMLDTLRTHGLIER